MNDDWYKPNPPKAPPRQAQPGEKLYEFLVGHDRYLFELRDHGRMSVSSARFSKTAIC